MSNYNHQPIRSKYGNRKVEYDGYKFDSQGESMRYYQLKMLQKAGKISGLQVHIPFELIPKDGKHRAIYYEADFVYIENGEKIVEDFKSISRLSLYRKTESIVPYTTKPTLFILRTGKRS